MKQVILYAIPFIFLAFVIFSVIYVSKRLSWAFSINPKLLALIIGAAVVFFLAGLIVVMRSNMTSGLSHFVNNFASIGLGVSTILIFTVIGIDIIQLIAKMPPKIFGYSILSVTLLISGYSIWNALNIKTYHQNVTLPNLVEPIKLAQLSDIHIGHFWGEKTVNKLVKIVEKESVDAVVITGDMFDGRVRLNEEVLKPFKRLNMPIYFVEGNHDGYSGSQDIKALLRENNIEVLDNKKAEIKGLQIVGLDYLLPDHNSVNTMHAPVGGKTMQEVLPTIKIDKSRASVLLHHNPVGINYAAENGLNLYLAGHTHAGQMFPATLIAKVMFEYNKGLYKYNDNTQIYVSQGSGTFGPPMRLGTKSEVTILNLEPLL